MLPVLNWCVAGQPHTWPSCFQTPTSMNMDTLQRSSRPLCAPCMDATSTLRPTRIGFWGHFFAFALPFLLATNNPDFYALKSRRFITMLVCRQVHASLFAGQEAYPRLHKKKWRISDEVLTCLLKMTLRMMDYIDTQTQRIGLCLLRNLAAVTTDTSLQWHSPSILWTIKFVEVCDLLPSLSFGPEVCALEMLRFVCAICLHCRRALRGRDLQVFRVLLPLSVSLLQRLESPPGVDHTHVHVHLVAGSCGFALTICATT